MRSFDLICNECRHRYHVDAEHAWIDDGKRCPECGSDGVHQTFRSYLRNGTLFSQEYLDNMKNRSSCCCCYGAQDDSCERETR